MAYLLELVQAEHRSVVGVLRTEADVLRLVGRLPGLHEAPDHPGTFWLEPSEVPQLTEIEHDGWVYPLCRASFSTYASDGVIYVGWHEVQIYDDVPPRAGSLVAGILPVDGYTFGIADGVEQVHARERLVAEAAEHFGARGQVVDREALGSQDGEYVTVAPAGSDAPGRLAFLLDPAAVLLRARCQSFEEFLGRYPDDLP